MANHTCNHLHSNGASDFFDLSDPRVEAFKASWRGRLTYRLPLARGRCVPLYFVDVVFYTRRRNNRSTTCRAVHSVVLSVVTIYMRNSNFSRFHISAQLYTDHCDMCRPPYTFRSTALMSCNAALLRFATLQVHSREHAFIIRVNINSHN